MDHSPGAGLTDRLRRWLPGPPPATPRNLWLALALLVALQNCAVFQSTGNEKATVLALLIWGGALICMEDQLEALRPRPGWFGLLLGTLLLLLVLARSSVILGADGVLFLLAPLAGLALGLLALPLHRLARLRDSLLCLLLFPLSRLITLTVPEGPLAQVTAWTAGFWVGILGVEVQVRGNQVLLAGGGVTVASVCNGVEIITMLICVAVIFLLAFPIRSFWSRMLLLLIAPLIGYLSNTLRIALLAVLSLMGGGDSNRVFHFFHDDAGSLVYSGLAVWVFCHLYLQLLERELSPATDAIGDS